MQTQNAFSQLNNRFAKILGGGNYAKLLRALPYYLELEELIASSAKESLVTSTTQHQVLELGCGTGFTTVALSHALTNARITAVDEEQKMLTEHAEKMKKIEVELRENKIVLDVKKDEILSFLRGCGAESFDVVVTGFTLHNIPIATRAEIQKEILRVLRIGGRFVNGDKIAHDDLEEHNQSLMSQIGTFIECYSKPEDIEYGLDWIEHYFRDNQPDIRQHEEEVKQILAKAGFANVKILKRFGMDAVVQADKIS